MNETPHDPSDQGANNEGWEPPLKLRRPNGAQYTVAAFILVFAVCVVLYKLLHAGGLEQTAALYIGLPAVLALGLTLTNLSSNPYWMAVKGISIAILLSALVVGEGFICVLMAAPLFYVVGIVIAAIVDFTRRSRTGEQGNRMQLSGLLLAPLVLMMSEGVTPQTTFSTAGSGSSSIVVEATPAQVDAALAKSVSFDTTRLPTYLSMGFPKPIEALSQGSDVGDQRLIMFAGAAKRPSLIKQHHWGHHDSTLILRVTEHGSSHLTFETVTNGTPVASWIDLKDIRVNWRAVDATHTEVTWTINYDRKLAPAWYFGPWEHYGVSKASEYLLHSFDFVG